MTAYPHIWPHLNIPLSEYDGLVLKEVGKQWPLVLHRRKPVRYSYGRLIRKNAPQHHDILAALGTLTPNSIHLVLRETLADAREVYGRHGEVFPAAYRATLVALMQIERRDVDMPEGIASASADALLEWLEDTLEQATKDFRQNSTIFSTRPKRIPDETDRIVIFPDGTIGTVGEISAFRADRN